MSTPTFAANESGEACEYGSCQSDTDCVDSYCDGECCAAPQDIWYECTSDSDCAQYEVCEDYVCVLTCDECALCPDGYSGCDNQCTGKNDCTCDVDCTEEPGSYYDSWTETETDEYTDTDSDTYTETDSSSDTETSSDSWTEYDEDTYTEEDSDPCTYSDYKLCTPGTCPTGYTCTWNTGVACATCTDSGYEDWERECTDYYERDCDEDCERDCDTDCERSCTDSLERDCTETCKSTCTEECDGNATGGGCASAGNICTGCDSTTTSCSTPNCSTSCGSWSVVDTDCDPWDCDTSCGSWDCSTSCGDWTLVDTQCDSWSLVSECDAYCTPASCTCTLKSQTCNTLCTAVSNTSSTSSGSESCTIANGTGTRTYTNTCNGKYTNSNCYSAGQSCSGCSSWARTSTGTCTVSTCNTDYYKTGTSTCGHVGTGYYSANGSTTRTACTNKPANSYYTGSGGGSNACGWACNAGYYKSGSSCVQCGAGYYCPAGSTSQTACGGGKYSAAGSDASSDCKSISAGCYGTSASSACPAECAAGTYSTGGASSCSNCPGGTYGATTGLKTSACSGSCTAGYYCPAGSTSAKQNACGGGKYSAAGSDASGDCKSISAGCYGTSASSACPAECPAGKYSTGGASSCTNCTNKPTNSSYTSATGNTSSSCPWSCNTGYSKNSAGTACVGISYTVKYNANGGSGTTESSSHTYGTTKALTSNGFTNGVKKFLGWSTSSTATSATYTNGQSVSNLTSTSGGTVTLYAVWGTCTACAAGTGATCTLSAPKGVCTYTTNCKTGYETLLNSGMYNPSCAAKCNAITLNANGGTAGSVATLYKKTDATGYFTDNQCLKGYATTTDVKPTRSGYSFRGFYISTPADVSATESNGVSRYITHAGAATNTGNSWTVNAASTLYAGWAKNCAAGTQATCTLVLGQNTSYTTGCNTGYNIKSGSGAYNPSCAAKCNAITLNANGGTAGSVATLYKKTDATGYFTDNQCLKGYATTTDVKPTRSGYSFRGFYISTPADVSATESNGVSRYITHAGAATNTGNSWTVNAASTLYAGWAKNCAAGTQATCTLVLGQNTSYTTGCNTGYNIKSGSGAYNPVCQANTYTVKYDINCPSGATCSSAPSNTSCSYGTTCTFSSISSTALYAGGYKLIGWGSSATGVGTTSGSNLTSTNGGTVTRYAIWSKCLAGTYHPAAIGTAANVCTSASKGSYVGSDGATAQTACAKGKYSDQNGATSCTNVASGCYAKSTGSTSSCPSSCPSDYPNSSAGSDAITDCYSGTKSRAWSGSQTACSKPSGCASVSCNTCSIAACDYVAYSNSAGTGDGTIKSGCSSNSDACQQTVKSVTANANRYVSGTTCPACPTAYPSSDGGNIGEGSCYVTKTSTGSQLACSKPANSATYACGTCTPGTCDWRDYKSATDTSCTPKNCTKPVSSVSCNTGYYKSGVSCPACTNKPSNSSYTGTASSNACPWQCNSGYNLTPDDKCGKFCESGITHIHLSTGLKVPLYASARTSPAINVKWNNTICYGSLATGTGSGLNVKYNGTTYHAID